MNLENPLGLYYGTWETKRWLLAPGTAGGFKRQELAVQVGKNPLKMRAVSGIAGRLQGNQRPGSNHVETFAPGAELQFLRCGLWVGAFLGFSLPCADLVLDGLAFPASSHTADSIGPGRGLRPAGC